MNGPTTVIAQAGHGQLKELQKVLSRSAISSHIVCPPDENLNR